MKILNLRTLLLLTFSGFLMVQCTSDPLPGPAGADGIDGIDGIDGADGADGTASCISCHSNSARDPIVNSFLLSKHGSSFIGFAAGRGGEDPTNRCAQCHGEEGFIDYLELGEADSLGYANPSPFNCTTCHSKHRTFDFENDGFDYALRNPDAQTLVIDGITEIDFGGPSNNCISCHQPRSSYVIPAENGTGKYVVTSTRFGPHHGPQSTMLEGIMGANLAGSQGYPGVASATHRTGSSCVECHMGESATESEGLHSWVPTDAACIECHPSGANDQIDQFDTRMAVLKQLLGQVVGEQYAVDSLGNPVFDMDGNPIGTGVDVTGIIVDTPEPDRSQEGIFSTAEAQAAWNYKTLLEDNSRGIHNPAYTRALLENSIEALED
ncbi:MAG: hypothetical protein ABF293_03780 [Flavobacteriaceae bacterium]